MRALNVVATALVCCGLGPAGGFAQTAPVAGIRPAEVRVHAIVDAAVVVSPGLTIDRATVIIRDGVIESVGTDTAVPPEARVWPGDGRTVYAGLIDSAVLVEVEPPSNGAETAGAHWSSRVHPEWRMSELPAPPASLRETLRELGFTAAAVYPAKGIFRGSGAVIALAEEDDHLLTYRERTDQAVSFNDRRTRGDRTYPGSQMGAIALIRQTLLDARWHAECRRLWEADPHGQEPPIQADALVALADVITRGQRVLLDVTDENSALRASQIVGEFELDACLLGSGYEFRRLDPIAAAGMPVIVPLDYPQRPQVSSLLSADNVSLRDMMTWEQAPTNPRRLVAAGVTVALTTHRLDKRSGFHAALRKAVRHGLSEDDALAALTTTPAALLGVGDVMGTVEAGKVANLVVVEGSLFDKKPKIRDTWVNGRRHEISSEPQIKFVGKGVLTTDTGVEADVELDTVKSKVTVHLPGGKKSKAKKVVYRHDRLSFVIDGRPFEADGYVRLTGIITEGSVTGTGALPDGARFTFTITPAPEETEEEPDEDADAFEADDNEEGKPVDDFEAAEEPQAPDDLEAEEANGDEDEDGDEDEEKEDEIELPAEELVYPLGAYGLAEPPQPRAVVVTNATIWTCGPQGIIANGTLFASGGRIVSVAAGPPPRGVPDDALYIDGTGKHVTAGLIDCHSHTGISGGVNEFTHANTAEVRIADVVNPDDINLYRQLAGGLTAANQLHGSANPIGGQNSVVKLKWSRPAGDFSVPDAIGGIKFALGENVKRSQGRYPNTRMGVEAIIRDAFTAARDYQAEWRKYESLPPEERYRTMPPRRDLQLDALVEILEGRRIVHCHSYRQDEILMLVRLADDFGFTIGTFQHVLEGYKVAEALAAHGAGASTFSDWWAYKVEVMDAIPFNGALMHDVGVVVSFNSDSSELARRLNTEAAKAVRYGGVDPAEALQFVTLNPARQLGIDDRTGSLEVGKDADFAIWSDSPLSTFARCEQTWIEGARYFDLDTDRALRARASTERQRLIQKILADAHGKAKSPSPDKASDTETEPSEPDEPEPVAEDRPYSCCWSHQE